jgi:hypothetical protein
MKNSVLLYATLFGLSMGFFESAVVVYLRQMSYPDGFMFPMQPVSDILAATELLREAFSLLMILSVSFLAGRNRIMRFAYFLYVFAVWDIFYYVFLKLLIDWPASFFTWDILFLLPAPWTGPVIAPVILSAMMLLLAAAIFWFSSKQEKVRMTFAELSILIAGSLVVIIGFIREFFVFTAAQYPNEKIWSLSINQLKQVTTRFVPQDFPWIWFFSGTAIIATGILVFTRRNYKNKSH